MIFKNRRLLVIQERVHCHIKLVDVQSQCSGSGSIKTPMISWTHCHSWEILLPINSESSSIWFSFFLASCKVYIQQNVAWGNRKTTPLLSWIYPETERLDENFMWLCPWCPLGLDRAKQKEKEPDEENVSLGLSLGVTVQLASLLARWQVQYQALGRVSPANYKICQQDLGKEREKKG